MKIREFQEFVRDRLNDVEALVQGGCKAFAEDTRTVYDEAAQFVSGGGVAIVVVTPAFDRSGDGTGEGSIPVEGEVEVRCIERPALAAGRPDALRALDAAEIVAHALDSDIFGFRSIRQTVQGGRDGATVTATATFEFAGELTND